MLHRPPYLTKRSVVALVIGFAFAACATPGLSTTNIPAVTSATGTVVTLATTATIAMSTPSYTPTSKATSAPTLTGDQQDRFLEKMLETNGGCELPCWWGGAIVPGKTTLEEARQFFHSQGISYLSRTNVVDVVFQVPHTIAMASWEYNARIIVTGQDGGIVQSVTVTGDSYSGEPTPSFVHAWHKQYGWDRLLTRLGIPTEVLILTSPATYAEPANYSLTLVYEKAGMLIAYAGLAQELGNGKMRACPRFDQVTSLTLRLVAPDMGGTLLEPRADAFTLKETTGMSLKTFHETFSAPNAVTCLDQDVGH